jgi:thymidylate synthase
MIVFKGQTFAECYRDSLINLFEDGIENNARGTISKELLDVALVVEDPTQCLYQNDKRGSQKKYIAAEFLWYYSGRNDVKFIANWAKFWESIQNEDGSANSAYGNLIFKVRNQHNLSQYQWAMQSLISDPIPDRLSCILICQLTSTLETNCHIRNNKFYMSVYMRSNDAVWGTPTDVAFFCSLQMQMYSQLKNFYPELELGSYTHVANSYHVYDRHYELGTAMLATDFKPEALPHVIADLVDIDGEPSRNLLILMDALSANDEPYLIFQDGPDMLKWIHTNVSTK